MPINYPLPSERVAIVSVLPMRLYEPMLHGVYVADPAPKVKGQLTKDGKRYTFVHLENEPDATTIPARAQWLDTKINDDPDPRTLINDMQPVPIPAPAIAEDIERKWSHHAYMAEFDSRPGVLALPVGQTEPTEEQIEDLLAKQEDYAKRVVMEGREFQATGEYKKISKSHLIWAQWLGLGDDPFRQKEMLGQPSGNGMAALMAMVLQQQAELTELKALAQQGASRGGVQPPLSPTSPKAVK